MRRVLRLLPVQSTITYSPDRVDDINVDPLGLREPQAERETVYPKSLNEWLTLVFVVALCSGISAHTPTI